MAAQRRKKQDEKLIATAVKVVLWVVFLPFMLLYVIIKAIAKGAAEHRSAGNPQAPATEKRGLISTKGAVILGALVVLAGFAARAIRQAPASEAPTETPVRAVVSATDTPRPTDTPTPTETPEPTATPYRIHGYATDREVYVSTNGVIYFDSDCSGMKHYTTMTLEQADAAGYEYCARCA